MTPSIRSRPLLAALALLAAFAGGCPGTSPPGAPAGDAGCPELPGRARARSSFTFALTGTVSPESAPVPTTRSEAIVFRLLYETLVDLDCAGQVVPGLAESWKASDDARTWTFRLRRDAWLAHADRPGRRPVDAALVRECWREARRWLRRGSSPPPWTWQLVRMPDVKVIDARHLEITTDVPQPDLPAVLSRPEFAVLTRRAEPEAEPSLAWPQGTRGVMADPLLGQAERDLVWWPESKDRGSPVARITFRVRASADPRDLVAADVDALLVDGKVSLEYLQQVEGFRVTPFPWNATYYAITRDPGVAESISGDVRQDLARWTVLSEARPARRSPRVFVGGRADSHPESDTFAWVQRDPSTGADNTKAIAARLAAVTREGHAASLAAVDTGEPAFDHAALVTPGARAYTDHLEETALLTRFPELAEGGWAIPLVETRSSLVTREGLAGIRAGHDGLPRLERAGWTRRSLP